MQDGAPLPFLASVAVISISGAQMPGPVLAASVAMVRTGAPASPSPKAALCWGTLIILIRRIRGNPR